MYPLIRCPSCNACLAHVVELYLALRQYKVEKMMEDDANKDKAGRQLEIDSDMEIHTDDCFKYLCIDRTCCKRVLVSNFQLDDLIYDSR